MSRPSRALILLLVTTFGLWGCAKGPANHANGRAVELKLAKVEDDLRVTLTGRDQLRKQLAGVEAQRTELQKQLAELKQQVSVRTSERDALQGQYDQFRENIRKLLGQAEAAATTIVPPKAEMTA